MLVDAHIQIAGPIDDLLATHHLLAGAPRDPASLPTGGEVISVSRTHTQTKDLALAYMSAPLIPRELEAGTLRLTFNESVTRL